MTFSIIGRCERTGAYGAAITTSDLAVGSRCVRLAHGRGAMLSQHRTDSRLGDLGISMLAEGESADRVVAKICASTADIEWRQIGALDSEGRAAFYHGRRMYSIYAHAAGRNCLGLGNILDNPDVPQRMVEAFIRDWAAPLADRLIAALEAGRDAGGEILGPLRSAALKVSGDYKIDTYDLRIDISDTDAVADLRALYEAYKDREDTIRNVALRPDTMPVMRSLFDASIARIEDLGLQDRFPTARNRESWTVKG